MGDESRLCRGPGVLREFTHMSMGAITSQLRSHRNRPSQPRDSATLANSTKGRGSANSSNGAKYSPRFIARRLGSPVADPPHGQRLPGGRSRGEQIVLSIQALEAVSAPRLERQSRGALSKVASDTRHEDLAGSRPGHDAGRGMHRQAPDVVAAHDHLAAVDAYADRELYRGQGFDQWQSTAESSLSVHRQAA